jgi:hypothetical protein
MNETDSWIARYGPLDGPWLQAEFARVTAGETGVRTIRIARLDDAAEMAAYTAQAGAAEEPGRGEAADWEVVSPYTDIRYTMGGNW